jgi:hypothetical protein
MYDILPFPNITGGTEKEQLAEMLSYLIQFKEELEFVLTNISTDNLSQDLLKKLNTLGADIEKTNTERSDDIQQVVNKTFSIADIINSAAFKSALQSVEEKVPGEYLVSAEQIQTSEEPGGINIFAVTDKEGTTTQFQVRNGKTPTVKLAVNYETGNLEYTIS